jgi:hypothetical protein
VTTLTCRTADYTSRVLQAAHPGFFDCGIFPALASADTTKAARGVAGWTMHLASVGEIIPEAVTGAERAGENLEIRAHDITCRRRKAAAAKGSCARTVHTG